MTEREMLELAAKAAGLRHVDYSGIDYNGRFGLVLVDEIGRQTCDWNPLADDGDAFRLAVKLNICVEYSHDNMKVVCFSVQEEDQFCDEDCGNDPYAATRLAITRAAAEIGKNMEGE